MHADGLDCPLAWPSTFSALQLNNINITFVIPLSVKLHHSFIHPFIHLYDHNIKWYKFQIPKTLIFFYKIYLMDSSFFFSCPLDTQMMMLKCWKAQFEMSLSWAIQFCICGFHAPADVFPVIWRCLSVLQCVCYSGIHCFFSPVVPCLPASPTAKLCLAILCD